MHEQQKGRKAEKLDFVNSGYGGDWVSAIYWRNRLGSPAYLYRDDRRAWDYYVNSFNQELTHNITIVITSAGGFGAGIGFLIIKLFGGW